MNTNDYTTRSVSSVARTTRVCITSSVSDERTRPGDAESGCSGRHEPAGSSRHRFAHREFDNLEPTTSVDSKTFDQRGYLDVGQALNELPAFGVSPSSAANTQAGFGIAQSFVDLYGLGSQRTLTLVNGRRFVSESSATLNNSNSNTNNGGNGTQVDLNVIPTKLIDHVEVVSVGGAPIYGSDAIAGVVNIILKKDYQGLDVDGQVVLS